MLKWLLVCLADNASPDGDGVFPSVGHLAQKTGMSPRTVQRNLRQLEERGLIEKVADPRRGRGTEWRLSFISKPAKVAPRPNRKPCPPKLRREIIEAFQHTCAYCGGEGDELNGPDGRLWHVDRILPGSRGGSYARENVTLACGRCNTKKGAKLAPNGGPESLADRVPNDAGMGAKSRDHSLCEPSEPSEDTFALFWKAYPERHGKKLAKGRAEEAWRKLSADERTRAQLGAEHYAAACSAGLTLAKDAFRWLRDGAFEDWQTPAEGGAPTKAGLESQAAKHGAKLARWRWSKEDARDDLRVRFKEQHLIDQGMAAYVDALEEAS